MRYVSLVLVALCTQSGAEGRVIKVPTGDMTARGVWVESMVARRGTRESKSV